MQKAGQYLEHQINSAQTELNDKAEIVSHVARGVSIQEDPTRSTLHTGERVEGTIDERLHQNGAPEKADMPSARDDFISAERSLPQAQAVIDGQKTVQTRSAPDAPEAPSSFSGSANEPFSKLNTSNTEGSPTVPEIPDVPPRIAAPVSSGPSAVPPPEQEVDLAPDALNLDNATVAENASGAAIGTLTVIDPNSSDAHEFTVSDDRFEIIDGELRIKPEVSLDHEDAAQIEVDVTATNAHGFSLTQTFTIEVLDVNEGPEGVSLSNSTVAENAAGAVVGEISVIDPDKSDSHSFEVSDDRFEVVDGKLRLKPEVDIDFETTQQIELEVTAIDAGGLSVSETFVVDIQDINEAPVDLSIGNATDNLVANGSFEEFDLDRGRWRGFDNDDSGGWTDAHGLEIWDNLWGTKASHGDQLLELDHARGVDSISQTIETEDGQLYDLGIDLRERLSGGTDTVEVYWNGQLVGELDPQSSDWETFQLQVVGSGQDTLELREPESQNDSYGALVDNITLTETQLSVAENTEGAIVGYLSFTDPDANDIHRFEVSDDRFEVVGNQLRLKPGVALDYEVAASIDIDVSVIDAGGLSRTETISITVADMPETAIASDLASKNNSASESYSKAKNRDQEVQRSFDESAPTTALETGPDNRPEGESSDAPEIQVSGILSAEEGGTIALKIDIAEASERATILLDGAPENTLFVSGEASLLSDGEVVNLDGWDLSSLEISPPAGFEGSINLELAISDRNDPDLVDRIEIPVQFTVGGSEPAGAESERMDASVLADATETDMASQPWDMAPEAQEIAQEADVLSETVTLPDSPQVSALDTQVYERFDW